MTSHSMYSVSCIQMEFVSILIVLKGIEQFIFQEQSLQVEH